MLAPSHRAQFKSTGIKKKCSRRGIKSDKSIPLNAIKWNWGSALSRTREGGRADFQMPPISQKEQDCSHSSSAHGLNTPCKVAESLLEF